MMNKKRVISMVLGIGLYLVVTGISSWVFGAFESTVRVVTPLPKTEEGGLVIDPREPRDQECPINGKMFTKTEKAAWEQNRPLFVMIENHTDSRPQSGLVRADVVYEAVAEGGITRFGAVYYCGAMANEVKLGPVRSARTYFLDWASEYNYPLYVHVGGANCSRDEGTKQCTSDPRVQALEQINKYGWGGRNGNDLNQFSIGYPVFWRKYERLGRTVGTEHTMETTTGKLWGIGEERGWTNLSPEEDDWKKGFEPWKFDDAKKTIGDEPAGSISFDFWEGYEDFAVKWDYDEVGGGYRRTMGGAAHVDLGSEEQITATTVVVQFTDEEGPLDQHKHMLYDTVGKGEAIIFNGGGAIQANWRKNDRISRTIYTDGKGREVVFAGGQIWIEVVPAGNTVEY